MAERSPRVPTLNRLASLALVLEWALGLRVLAADVVQWYSQRKGSLCIFPDTKAYWLLAGAIARGGPYEVLEWGDIPHFALRTPGYPLFLAASRLVFGDRPLAARLVQAALGALSVWLVYRLSAAVAPRAEARGSEARGWTIPLVAAAFATFDPFAIATSALLLSEALFVPLMLASLWGLAELWPSGRLASGRQTWPWALGTGLATGAAVLVRPSWALFVPAVVLAWVAASGKGRRAGAFRAAVVVAAGTVLVLAPWWVRNARVYGRFVPTAIWMGASLYDGLNPRATGASDMDAFMSADDIWPLDEETQDAVLRDRALAFARAHPGRVIGLAAVKLARFWSPWPNADSFRSPAIALASAVVTLPTFALMALGIWDRRRDPRALVLLAGPLAYFCALHLIFASSMRYRIPAEVPALALAAIGFGWIVERRRKAAARGQPEGEPIPPGRTSEGRGEEREPREVDG